MTRPACLYPDEPDHDHAYWCPPPRDTRAADLVRIVAGVALVLLVAAMGALWWRTGAPHV